MKLTKQTCERVIHEKRSLEVEFGAQVNSILSRQRDMREARDDNRKLERQVENLKEAKELTIKCTEFKTEVRSCVRVKRDLGLQTRELQRKLRDRDTALEHLRSDFDRQAKELSTLRRALSLKAEELSMKGGVDIHSRLLFAIAQV